MQHGACGNLRKDQIAPASFIHNLHFARALSEQSPSAQSNPVPCTLCGSPALELAHNASTSQPPPPHWCGPTTPKSSFCSFRRLSNHRTTSLRRSLFTALSSAIRLELG